MDLSKVLVFGSFKEEEASFFQKAAEKEGLLSFRQNGLQFGSFGCQIESPQISHEVPSKEHPIDGQGTERGHLELNGNPDSPHCQECFVSNGGRTDQPSRKKQGSSRSQDRGSRRSLDSAVATTNGGDISSTKVKSRGESVINENGVKKSVDRVGSLQESENESSSKFLRDPTIEQLEALSLETNSSVKEVVENPTSLTEDIPMSEAEKFGQKVGHGQVVYSHGVYKGMTKSGIVSATSKTSQCNSWKARGLINAGNLCFLNATLQALVSCAPFFQLLQTLKSHDIPEVGYPLLRAFAEFVAAFEEDKVADAHLKKNEKEVGGLEVGKPFRPSMFDPVLKLFSPDQALGASGSPRQEDAQEFLSFVMHQMHDELLQLENKKLNGSTSSNSSLVTVSQDDEWETVGPKNRSAVTTTLSLMESNLSVIFGGQLRSVIKSRGNKASATIQPYLLLHLEIFSEVVKSVEDALHVYSSTESLESYRISTGKEEAVSARKSVKLQTLSKVLVLHLMRFSYGTTGISKLHKPVRFSPELVIGRELLVSPTTEGRRYELVASISHHGRDPSKGHYTADTKHSNGQWLRYDDSCVSVVGLSKVLHEQAYILFYKQL